MSAVRRFWCDFRATFRCASWPGARDGGVTFVAFALARRGEAAPSVGFGCADPPAGIAPGAE
jgi:hypothetical protein